MTGVEGSYYGALAVNYITVLFGTPLLVDFERTYLTFFFMFRLTHPSIGPPFCNNDF